MELTALETRCAHWRTKKKIDGTDWEISGFSRSSYRTGFYIPNLDIMLDAGPQNFSKPSHIFITHTHIDHIASLPLTMIGRAENNHIFNIYAKSNAEKYIRNYIQSMFALNAMEDDIPTNEWFIFHGLEDSTFRTVFNKTPFEVRVITCDHSVPTISYGFSEIKKKLKKEYHGLKGKEIKQLKDNNVEITEEVVVKRLAYICDTSIKVLENYPDMVNYNVVFIECTFIFPEELENAIKTQHIHWSQLKPYVLSNPETTFMLFHFSMRYRDKEIKEFFDELNLPNVRYWV